MHTAFADAFMDELACLEKEASVRSFVGKKVAPVALSLSMLGGAAHGAQGPAPKPGPKVNKKGVYTVPAPKTGTDSPAYKKWRKEKGVAEDKALSPKDRAEGIKKDKAIKDLGDVVRRLESRAKKSALPKKKMPPVQGGGSYPRDTGRGRNRAI